MKIVVRYLVLLVLVAPAIAADKPCIAFSAEGDPSYSQPALTPLQTAVTLSGDFDFYTAPRKECWLIIVVGLPMRMQDGGTVGYIVSYVLVDHYGFYVTHGLQTGPTQQVYDSAMRDAAADAIRNIRKWERSQHQ